MNKAQYERKQLRCTLLWNISGVEVHISVILLSFLLNNQLLRLYKPI